MSDHLAALEEYRGIREAIETSIIPMATSVDGRRFEYQASLHELELEAGGYVAIESHGETRLGQVLSLRMEQQEASALERTGTVLIRVARGDGAVLEGDDRPFHDARVRPATGVRCRNPQGASAAFESGRRVSNPRPSAWEAAPTVTTPDDGGRRTPLVDTGFDPSPPPRSACRCGVVVGTFGPLLGHRRHVTRQLYDPYRGHPR